MAAAEVTEGTSDDTHLAGDSKRRENAAGCNDYAPPVQEECRMTEDTSIDAHHAGNAITDKTFYSTVPRSPLSPEVSHDGKDR